MDKKDNSLTIMLYAALVFIAVVVGICVNSRGKYLKEVRETVMSKAEVIRTLIEEEIFKAEISRAYQKNKKLIQNDIAKIDQLWISADPNSEFVQILLDNPASSRLQKFTRNHPEFKEIFITDRLGLLVASTNKTSDYYQADEKWWIRISHRGGYLGEMEYDDSAHAWSYPIFEQIRDDQGNVIGVVKAVLDIRNIR